MSRGINRKSTLIISFLGSMTRRINKEGTKQKIGSTGFQPVPEGQLSKSKRLLPHWQMGG